MARVKDLWILKPNLCKIPKNVHPLPFKKKWFDDARKLRVWLAFALNEQTRHAPAHLCCSIFIFFVVTVTWVPSTVSVFHENVLNYDRQNSSAIFLTKVQITKSVALLSPLDHAIPDAQYYVSLEFLDWSKRQLQVARIRLCDTQKATWFSNIFTLSTVCAHTIERPCIQCTVASKSLWTKGATI